MQIVWYLRGEKAGEFEAVSDAKAKTLVDSGQAQIHDGESQLQYPENHPDVIQGRVEMEPAPAPKTTSRKRKYPNKNMTTDEDTGVGEN